MNRIPAVLFAALLTTGIVQAAEGPPLAPLPGAWELMGNGGPQALPGRCEIGTDSQKSMDGKPVYSVLCASNVLPSFAGARTNFVAAAYRGKRVRVSAGILTIEVVNVPNAQYPNAQGEAGLWIGVGTPRDGMRQDRMQDRTLKGSTAGWEVREFVVDIPEDADQLQAGFWMQGKGQMWMRDLKVEEVPTTVAVNFVRNAPKPEAAPDMSLAPATAPRPNDFFLPPPQKWLAMGEQNFELCDAGIDAKMLLAGQRNLSIACKVPLRANLRQATEAPPWWGKRVRLSGWLKTENVEPRPGGAGQIGAAQPGAALYLAVPDGRGQGGQVYNAVVIGTTEWTYQELVVDIPRAGPFIPMGLSLIGTGQVWVRDLKFEEVSRDTPVTPLPGAIR
jgi:hypothetical protein